MRRDTEILQAGYRGVSDAGVLLPGPQSSATYVTPGNPADHAMTYGRFQNPTWTAFEHAIAVLEGGEAVIFASGMAAVAAVFGVTLKAGDIVVLPSDCYYTTRMLASNWLQPIGVEVRLAPTREIAHAALLERARLLWLETPTNPQLDVCDIQEAARLARAAGVLVAADNTTATAYLQRPLMLGADYVIASDTKR